jgi:hypothetical protein
MSKVRQAIAYAEEQLRFVDLPEQEHETTMESMAVCQTRLLIEILRELNSIRDTVDIMYASQPD